MKKPWLWRHLSRNTENIALEGWFRQGFKIDMMNEMEPVEHVIGFPLVVVAHQVEVVPEDDEHEQREKDDQSLICFYL